MKHTRCWTESDVIIHTWNRFSCLIRDLDMILSERFIFREFDATVTDAKYSPKCTNRLLNSRNIWTKIYSPISNSLPCFDQFWNRRIGDLEIGKIFIILHEDIVLWREMFDKIGFEDERLNFCLAENNLDICNFSYHLSLGDREIIGFDKI